MSIENGGKHMEKRDGFLTFLTALIPGVGYMYLGLVKKGIQFLVLFLTVRLALSMLGMNFLSLIASLSIWIYTFFDTFNVASKLDRGEKVEDMDYVFDKNSGTYTHSDGVKINRKFAMAVAWFFIAIGAITILNKVFELNELYILFKGYLSKYFLPVLLIFAGIYILFRNKRR